MTTKEIIETIGITSFMFIFTLVFAHSHRIFKKSTLSSYLKCFACGVIIAAIIFDTARDLYEDQDFKGWCSNIGPLSAGLSFLLLVWIDKLYLAINQGEHDSVPEDISLKKAVVFVLALSIHSFLEGLGFAAKSNKRNDLGCYLLVILGHKWMEAFALGVSVANAPFIKNTANWLLILYSALTPIGMIVSKMILIFFNKHFKEMILCILTGVSTGSFFYIGFVEMLHSEFEEHNHSKSNSKKTRSKLAAITLGFASMAVIFTCLGATIGLD
ncbi:hypothetical protein EDEG_00350 [Edhazardia aedis USNM 41457]|uniref:Zinc/iron permease n=1 Tax=Edhazardia aedis (strain USNM 41457) TaxID=1003232 RepID=J9D2F5_EDHAE|nr:hypothetical protein EDEG_00350 [Edhazardia aedis USNM 41457]|eukprot:EJW01759.1 hypothetical protein EDEG_00350 [Edhazardia aedis USNM 41457]